MGLERTSRTVVRAAALVLALGPLAGCAGTALTLAGMAGDAVSRATTGKSMIDAAMSGLADRDCAADRILTGAPLCRDAPEAAPKPAPAIAIALAAPDSMPMDDVRLTPRDGRPITWAPVAGGWVPLDPSAAAADGIAVSELDVAAAPGPAPGPPADAIIFAAAGSDERIDGAR